MTKIILILSIFCLLTVGNLFAQRSGNPSMNTEVYYAMNEQTDYPEREEASDSSEHLTMLLPNDPNPFNPETTLAFYLEREAEFTIDINDVKGQLVQQFSGIGRKGRNTFVWDGCDNCGNHAPSGVYMITMESGEYAGAIKAILMK